MKSEDKEVVRKAVRENYAKVAKRNGQRNMLPMAGCCSGTPQTNGEASNAASCCGETPITPDQISSLMGYSPDDIKDAPDGANMGLGCGNPVALASLKQGETVVDLGSGGGFDSFLAAKHVGDSGKVIGVDMTPEMVAKARENAGKVGAQNVDFRLGEIENLPIADNTADIIMSNCVINLSPDKKRVFQEAYRILKPGGRLAISDIVATAELPEAIRKNLALIAACVGGAARIEEISGMLQDVGFGEIKITPKEESREWVQTWFPDENLADLIVSAYIEAKKTKSD